MLFKKEEEWEIRQTRNKHCRLGEEAVCSWKQWQGTTRQVSNQSGLMWQWDPCSETGLGCVQELLRSKSVPPCPVLLPAALVYALRLKAESLKIFQRGVIRENLVLNSLLTDEDVSSYRWCVYLSRRWRGLLGPSLKLCMAWRILKRPHCALTTAGQKTWKVENQKNSNCKCPNHEGNICLEWITKDVVNSPELGVKQKIPWNSRKVQGLIQRSESEMLWCMLCKRPDQMIGLAFSGLQKYEPLL